MVMIDYLLSRLNAFGMQKLIERNNENHEQPFKLLYRREESQDDSSMDDDSDDDDSANDSIFLLPWLPQKVKGGGRGSSHRRQLLQNDKMMCCPHYNKTNFDTSASTLSTVDMMDSLTSLDGFDHDAHEEAVSIASRAECPAAATPPTPVSAPVPEPRPPPVPHHQQWPKRPKTVRFAVAANGRDLKTTIHRYPAATCPVTHGLSTTTSTSTIDDLDFAETRSRLCAVLYLSEDEIWRIRMQQKKRAAMYAGLARMYVPCVDRLFDGRGFASASAPPPKQQENESNLSIKNINKSSNKSSSSTTRTDNVDNSSPDQQQQQKKKRQFTEKDAIRLITSASIRGLEYPCSIKMQGHRQWAKDKILDCQEECRYNMPHLHADEAAQYLAEMCTRVSRRPKAFARKLAMGDAYAAQQILMSQDVATSGRELHLLSKRGLGHGKRRVQPQLQKRPPKIDSGSF